MLMKYRMELYIKYKSTNTIGNQRLKLDMITY